MINLFTILEALAVLLLVGTCLFLFVHDTIALVRDRSIDSIQADLKLLRIGIESLRADEPASDAQIKRLMRTVNYVEHTDLRYRSNRSQVRKMVRQSLKELDYSLTH